MILKNSRLYYSTRHGFCYNPRFSFCLHQPTCLRSVGIRYHRRDCWHTPCRTPSWTKEGEEYVEQLNSYRTV